MATLIGGESAHVGALDDLVELNREAIEAFAAAIARVRRPGDRGRLADFLEDHERCLADLAAVARELGDRVADAGELRPRLTRARLSAAAVVGDRVILEAMKSSEEEVLAAYEQAASRAGLPDRARAVVERGLAAERRHCDWIAEQLDAVQGLMLLPL